MSGEPTEVDGRPRPIDLGGTPIVLWLCVSFE